MLSIIVIHLQFSYVLSAYFEKDNGLEVFIAQEEMSNVKIIEDLKDLVNKKIEEFSL
ncbi:MAG: hypothetical protein ACFFHV_19855 [Promethearchaeota archaeon]